ncbi:MAG: riboflavin synthase [Trueperaceae bacterium]
MFTGIIEEVGTVVEAHGGNGDLRIRVAARLVTQDLTVGDSIAVSGCCLTATEVDGAGFSAELSQETVAKTAPRWQAGARVNLERAMAANGRFGGHVVSGHVEGVGEVLTVRREPGAFVLTVRAPQRLAGYLIPKGSVTVDGVSLTVVDVGGPAGTDARLAPSEFTLWLIPHTQGATTLGELAPGSTVNLEADLIAKYLERLQLVKEPENVP